MPRLQSLTGFFALAFLAWLFSENRRNIHFRTVLPGLALQFILALFLLKFPGSREIFLGLNQAVQALEESTRAGTAFVFGYLGGGDLPFDPEIPGASYILAFRGLPLVLVMSALSALFFYWRIIPVVVNGFSWILQRAMAIGGVEGLGSAANVFVGMVESPLLIRPYLSQISRSTLFTLMTCGMATIAGTVMVFYASLLRHAIPDILGHLLIASIVSAPAAITVSKLMIPETSHSDETPIQVPRGADSVMDAVTRGTLAALPQGTLSERSRLIMVYAMCGFANLGSLGIMIGGMGAMVKERRPEIVALGLKSIVAGTLATCMTGCLMGLLY
ncbi:MAG: NupC/NupG family nucleoside CNT transporter [Desulfobacteraceae bacterium]